MNVLVVDDHTLFREGLSYLLLKLANDVSILEAADYDSALSLLASNSAIDLTLLDLNLPGKDGFELLNTCLSEYPDVPVTVLSASNSSADMHRALDMGAMGFIPKDSSSELMLSALRTILAGGYYLPSSLIKRTPHKPPLQSGDPFYLTERQLEVTTLVCDGLSNRDIASALDLAEATIKMHVTSIIKTLGATNRTHAAKIARERDLIRSSH